MPLHDWASHGADAFRYGAVAVKDVIIEDKTPKFANDMSFKELMEEHQRRSRQRREMDQYR